MKPRVREIDSLAKQFKSTLELAGLPRIRLYDLRHTAATLALEAGVPPKVVSEQLGHFELRCCFILHVREYCQRRLYAGYLCSWLHAEHVLLGT